MFGINPGEFAVLLLVALIVVGPERLPRYAQQLGRLVREGRKMAMGLREQVRGELGPEFDDVDWTKLDPRQYDPRKIIRDALTDTLDDEPKAVSPGGPKPATTPAKSARPGSAASPMAAAAAGAAVAAAAEPSDQPAVAEPAPVSAPERQPVAEKAPEHTVSPEHTVPVEHTVPAARTSGGAPVDLEAT